MAKKKAKRAVPAASAVKNQSDNLLNEALASALSAASTVLMKVCRLCETKDGPFLNIFDADHVTAKKIEELMPFVVSENDDLPHKICFRCSAKVEELHEFIQKCVKTQQNLHNTMGKTGPVLRRTKERVQWEEKLNKSTLSNDMICDALIKKAMEGIEDMPLKLFEDEVKQPAKKSKYGSVKNDAKNAEYKTEDSTGAEITLKNMKLSLEKIDEKVPAASNGIGKSQNSNSIMNNSKNTSQKEIGSQGDASLKVVEQDANEVRKVNTPNFEGTKLQQQPFNIMDHVSKIKVNGVGILFQCKLCNKNFLKIEVVESHGCAKNGAPKVDFTKHIPPPQPPKAPSVKFIKIDGNLKKNKEVVSESTQKPTEIKKTDKGESLQPVTIPPPKHKPRIGPASKVRRQKSPESDVQHSSTNLSNSQVPQTNQPTSTVEVNQAPGLPVVSFPTMPKLNSRYSFVPGPNNTFTLVEEPSATAVGNVTAPPVAQTSNNNANAEVETLHMPVRKVFGPGPKSRKPQKSPSPEVIDLDDNDETPSPPYPVGLFKTTTTAAGAPSVSVLPTFSTPAMKKQMYTVVQTGNPSKLLISSKAMQPGEEPPKKRQKKTKELKESSKEPFKVTLEDATPAKDPGIFTFINVDPLLQPSYVLPTDSIQESQISTTQGVNAAQKKEKDSSNKMYACNMCSEQFSREKKLLSHIQSHYNKMDEEDLLRQKSKKRKSK